MITRYQLWECTGLCGAGSNQFFYKTVEDTVRLNAKSISRYTWDETRRCSIEVDECGTPMIFIREIEVDEEVVGFMDSLERNLKDVIEQVARDGRVADQSLAVLKYMYHRVAADC